MCTGCSVRVLDQMKYTVAEFHVMQIIDSEYCTSTCHVVIPVLQCGAVRGEDHADTDGMGTVACRVLHSNARGMMGILTGHVPQ